MTSTTTAMKRLLPTKWNLSNLIFESIERAHERVFIQMVYLRLLLAHHRIEAVSLKYYSTINLDAYQQPHWIVDLRFLFSERCRLCFAPAVRLCLQNVAQRKAARDKKTLFTSTISPSLYAYLVLVSSIEWRILVSNKPIYKQAEHDPHHHNEPDSMYSSVDGRHTMWIDGMCAPHSRL